MVPTRKTNIGKTSKFVDAEGYNRNERGRESASWNGSTEKGGTGRCENIKNLYIGVTSTTTRPFENVALTTKDLQERNIQMLDGTTVENKGKTIN